MGATAPIVKFGRRPQKGLQITMTSSEGKVNVMDASGSIAQYK